MIRKIWFCCVLDQNNLLTLKEEEKEGFFILCSSLASPSFSNFTRERMRDIRPASIFLQLTAWYCIRLINNREKELWRNLGAVHKTERSLPGTPFQWPKRMLQFIGFQTAQGLRIN